MRASSLALEAAALLAALLALTARSLSLSARHPVPLYDEVYYLLEARPFAGARTAEFAACWLSARCRGDVRNPLYEIAAARFMSGGPGDFASAKLVTLACAWLLVLCVYGFTRRARGRAEALAAAAVLALSWPAALLSQQVLADVLAAALFFGALAGLRAWRERPAGWLAFGALAGLGYLCKPSGHFLLLAAAALALWRARRGKPAAAPLALSLAGFGAGASLALIRNARVWGNPFHNVNDKVVWLDGWAQALDAMARPRLWSRYGLLPYLRSHSLLDCAGRLAGGLRDAAASLGGMLGAWPFADSPTAAAAGAALLVAAAWGARRAWREGRQEEVLSAFAFVLPLFLAHSWAAKIGLAGPRFMLPLAAVLAPFAAAGARAAARPAADAWGLPPSRREDAAAALVLACALAALAGSWSGLARDPRSFWLVPPNWADASAWIDANVRPGKVLTPSESYYSKWDADWDPRSPASYDAYDEDLAAERDARGLDFVLVDASAASNARWPSRFGALDAWGPTTFLGWPRAYHDPLKPSQLLIYRRPRLLKSGD